MNTHLESLETLLDSDSLKLTKLLIRSGAFWKTENNSHRFLLIFESETHIVLDETNNTFILTEFFDSLLSSLSV